MVRRFSYLILLAIILISCNPTNKDLLNDLTNIVGKEIVIPEGLVPINFPDTIKSSSFKNNNKYKIVVYIDSMTCSECKLRKIFPWNDYFYFFYSKRVPVYIIMNTSNVQGLKKVINMLDLKFPFFIDPDGNYKIMNTISKNEIFRTVLVKENKVLLAGDPIFNNKLMKLYIKEISKD
ncbi:MAG: hypothetical protein ABFC28_06540 [Rikenellaceae bacterium]